MTDFAVHTTEDGVGVVAPKGRLTMTCSRQFKEVLTDLVDSGTTRIVVDMAETTFLDSSGLGALIGGLRSTRQAGGDLRVARPTPEVSRVFRLTNLENLLRARDTVEGAFDA